MVSLYMSRYIYLYYISNFIYRCAIICNIVSPYQVKSPNYIYIALFTIQIVENNAAKFVSRGK